MTTYRIEYIVSNLYTAEIDIPDHVHPSKRAGYVLFHIDSARNEEPVSGTRDVEVKAEWIEEV